MEHKTRVIAERERPLAVEYIAHTGQRKREDDVWEWLAPQQVSLFYPEQPGWHGREQVRLLNLSPQAALALLAWLTEEQSTLMQLVQEEEEQGGK